MKRRTMRRIDEPGTVRFLTFSCYRRLPLLCKPLIRDHFVNRLARVSIETAMPVLAWVVMHDHVHIIILPDEQTPTLTRFTHALKRPFALEVLNRWRTLKAPILSRLRHESGYRFWQTGGGYDRNVVGDELLEKIRYVHLNPVRKGLVERPVGYGWSSAAAYEGDAGLGPAIDF